MGRVERVLTHLIYQYKGAYISGGGLQLGFYGSNL